MEVNNQNIQIELQMDTEITLKLTDFVKIYKSFREFNLYNVDPKLHWTADKSRIIACENILYSDGCLSMFNIQFPLTMLTHDAETLAYENTFVIDN